MTRFPGILGLRSMFFPWNILSQILYPYDNFGLSFPLSDILTFLWCVHSLLVVQHHLWRCRMHYAFDWRIRTLSVSLHCDRIFGKWLPRDDAFSRAVKFRFLRSAGLHAEPKMFEVRSSIKRTIFVDVTRRMLWILGSSTVVHKITGLHEIKGQAVQRITRSFCVYLTEESVNRKCLNKDWTWSKIVNLCL
jgi:hypothetical protein